MVFWKCLATLKPSVWQTYNVQMNNIVFKLWYTVCNSIAKIYYALNIFQSQQPTLTIKQTVKLLFKEKYILICQKVCKSVDKIHIFNNKTQIHMKKNANNNNMYKCDQWMATFNEKSQVFSVILLLYIFSYIYYFKSIWVKFPCK